MRAILTALFCAVFLVACASTPSETTPTDTTDTAAPADTSTAPGAAPNAPAPADDKPTGGDAKSVFGSMFGANVEYMVAYDITSDAGGKPVTIQTTQYSKYKSGDYKMRTDTSYAGMEMRMIIADDTYISCTKSKDEWSCYEPPKGEDTEQQYDDPQADAKEYAQDGRTMVARDGTMQVAGVTADCFLVTTPAHDDTDAGSSRYCVKDNVPLYVKTMDKAGKVFSEMKATKYSTKVSDSEFEPPATPTDKPSYAMPEGYTMPEGYDMPSR